ncbi:hypothetical protein [Tabrizicola sp.]|uniref:hypothetical protein n=1 Tax=Tabrizicola sp. TaxID=2005166 RepID=UPI0025EAF307|nr:hypothetical protein [Tabrizicola sp.]MBY0350520.1 hypothetical protein [Tabrizicola sp.]
MTIPAGPAPIEAFLAPLVRITRRKRDIDGLVFWGGPEGWPDQPSEALAAEEIAFYAEGLLLEGFNMDWTIVADAAGAVDHLRLCFWQDGPPPPVPPPGWTGLETGRWGPGG